MSDDIFFECFLQLSRWDLDAASFSCRRFRSVVDKRMTRVCFRQLKQAKITKTGTFLCASLRDDDFGLNQVELTKPAELGQTFAGRVLTSSA